MILQKINFQLGIGLVRRGKMKAEQVAKMLEKHEEDANRRFDRIEKILDKLDMRMWGLAVLIVGVAVAACTYPLAKLPSSIFTSEPSTFANE